VLLAVLLHIAAAAQADGRDVARQRFKEGSQHYDLGEYKEALAAFKDAYREYEDPSFLFNIAQCYRQLGDKDQAVRLFRTFIAKLPDAPNRDEVRATIATLQDAIDRERAARSAPPTGTMPPSSEAAAMSPASEPAPTAAVTRADHPTPVYKKWWLWTLVGVVVVGAAVGTGVGVAAAGSHPSASTTFGTFKF
jgi:tetratricopeptide (TPR) repeat protein